MPEDDIQEVLRAEAALEGLSEPNASQVFRAMHGMGGEVVGSVAAFRALAAEDRASLLAGELQAGLANRGAVCFTFDGLEDEIYTTAHPAAVARDIRLTGYMISSWIDTAGKVTSAQLLEMFESGHEIGSHGKTNTDMTTFTAAQRVAEWDDSKTAIEAVIGAGNCNHWSYPQGGISNAATLTEAFLRYSTQRLFATPLTARASLPINRVPYITLRAMPWTSTGHAEVLSWIAFAARNPMVVLFRAQTITDGTSGPTPSQLTEAFDLVESLGVPALTVEEVFGAQLWHPNAGFESDTAGWAKVGGGTFTVVTDTPATGYNGTKSAKLVNTASGSDAILKTHAPLWSPGQVHTLSFRYRIVDNGGTGSITARLDGLDYLDASASGTSSSALTATSWTQATVDYTVHANTRQIGVQFTVPGTKNADLYIDHVHVGPKSHGVYG